MLIWLVRYAWRKARDGGPAVTTLSIGGRRFTLDWAAAEHVAVREILIRGEYWPTPEFRPRRGEIVVDVGANAGVFATVAADRIGPTGRLIAIEPNPLVVPRLRRNIDQNGFADRAEVIEAGVGDQVGSGRLAVERNSTIGRIDLDDPSSSNGILVVVETLDHLARDRQVEAIDLLKIDVEGLEVATLRGAVDVLTRCRRLVLEVSAAADVDAVVEHCRRAGFVEVTTRPAGIDSGATLVFARRDLADAAGV